MKHILEISQLSLQEIQAILARAFFFKQQQSYPSYKAHQVALLFYENSTRTRVSFELAAHHLSMPLVHLDLNHSSERKGEEIIDTLSTLAAMGIQYFVLRHSQAGMQQLLAQTLDKIHIVNAGDGTHAHPSQALLDIMTIIERKPNLEQLKIAIVGDIKHSRVAQSFQCICQALGVGELVLIAPESWTPELVHYGRVSHHCAEGLLDADVVMCLRVQKERLLKNEQIDLDIYRKEFALTQEKLSYAKPDVMVLHPGPMNRGIEIDSQVADGPQSFILQQVTNGVYLRMALFDALVQSN